MTVLSQIFAELRRRGVFGTTVVYVVAAWVFIQVASELFPAFNIPEFAIRYVWIGVVTGFPLALIVGWMYDISTSGIKRTSPRENNEVQGNELRRSDFIVLSSIFIVALGLVLMLLNKIVGLQEPFTAQTVAKVADPNSVAVLPLDNFTGDPDQAYFVAAFQEALITSLTGVSALKVISRTSSSAFVNSNKTVPEIGRELGAANIVEGSVSTSGDRVRITVQLINTLTDEHLWAKNYEHKMEDVLSLNAEVTRAIARQIQVTLTPREDSKLSSPRKVDPEIYKLYLKGMYFLNQNTPEGVQKGLPYLHQAVELDPSNAEAHAGLALGYNTIGHGIGRDAFPKAMAAARQALALDENSGTAWTALAEAQLFHEYDWEESARSFRRALQLAPSLDQAHGNYAWVLALLGRWDEAFVHEQKARELNPLNPYWQALGGWLYMVAGDYEKAEAMVRESFEIAPGYPAGLYTLGQLYTAQGRFEEAVGVHEQIPAGHPMRNWALGISYAMAGRVADARRLITEMSANPGPKDRISVALAYAGLGDFDEAMRWFEICYETRVDWLPFAVLDHSYGGVVEEIRKDPRFQALILKLGLSNYLLTRG